MYDNINYQLVTVKRRNEGIVSRGFFKGKDILVKNYYQLNSGDFLISKRQVVHGATGLVPDHLDGAIVSNEYFVSIENDNITTNFLTIISKLPQMYKMFFLSSYGIDIEKLVFNIADWKKRMIYIPKIDEQEQIGTLFNKLDNTIALHQEKALTLRRAKKSFLQSLFPTAHKSVPQLRFTNFKDNWNQRELGDIFTERSDRSSIGELISVTINSGVIKSSELIRKDNSSSNKSNYKIVKKNDIAYNSMRMWQGASGYSVYDGILSPAYTVITPREGIDAELFSFLFKRNDMIQIFQKNSQGLTSDTWNLKFPTLSKIKINVPDNQEQLTIKKFLKHVDIMITLQQTKIDKLQKIKKAYLQKMFI